jgi:hypothetical protein
MEPVRAAMLAAKSETEATHDGVTREFSQYLIVIENKLLKSEFMLSVERRSYV